MNKTLDFIRKHNGLIIAVILIIISWGVVIALCGESPLETIGIIIKGAFKNEDKISSGLSKIFIYFFAAMAFSVPAWTGMNNVGADGQLIFGGFVAALVPLVIKTGSSFINIFLCLFFAVIAGGLWALWPGILKEKYNVNEIVTTLLSAYIIQNFCEYMAAFPLRTEGSQISRMAFVPDNFKLPAIPGTMISSSLIFVIVALILVEIFRKKSVPGYCFRMTGENLFFAKQGGINTSKVRILSMFIGGGFAGLAGGLVTLTISYTYQVGFSANYGMLGMLVALICANMPVLILIISWLFCILFVGAINVQVFTSIPSEITGVFQSLMVFFVVAKDALTIKSKGGERK